MSEAQRTGTRAWIVIAIGIAVTIGFVAGRRYPFAFLHRKGAAVVEPNYFHWRTLASSPITRYEAASAAIDGKVYLFGGFYTPKVEASVRVDVFDPATNTWTRKHDLPKPFTHANAVVVGRTVWFAGGFVGNNPGATTADVWKYDIAADSWSNGPSLPAPRAGGALALIDGSLHYAAGFIEDRDTGSPDHWVLKVSDSSGSARWVRAAPVPIARGHVAGAALDGKFYLIGGAIRHDPYPSDQSLVQRYDPATDRWENLAPLPFPLSHTEPATFTRNGHIFVVGGRSRPTRHDAMQEVLEYSPRQNHWRALPPTPAARFGAFAVPIGDDVVGGAGGTGTNIPHDGPVWIGNWIGQWQLAEPMPLALGNVAGGVIGDHLFVVGQGDHATLALDLASGRWETPDRFQARIAPGYDHAAEVFDGKLYLLGGVNWNSAPIMQIFDPLSDTWTLGPNLPFATGAAASAVINGMIYLAGGIANDSTTNRAARFDVTTGTWSSIAPMPRGRSNSASGTDGHRFFVFGGETRLGRDTTRPPTRYDDVQIYDPVANRWTTSGKESGSPARLPRARSGMGKAVYFDGEFYVMGGETFDSVNANAAASSTRVDIYNPVTNQWREGLALPTSRSGSFPVLDDDAIYLAGGRTPGSGAPSALLEILRPAHASHDGGPQ